MQSIRPVSAALFALWLLVGQGCDHRETASTTTPAPAEAVPAEHWKRSNPEAHAGFGFLKDWGRDIVELPLETRHWGPAEYLEIGAIAATGLVLYSQDDRIRDYIQRHRSATRDRWAKNLQQFGAGLVPVAIVLGLYGTGELIDDRRARRTALVAVESIATSALFNQTLKYGTHRHRPNSGDDRSTWGGPSFSSTNLSFASGHTTAAFALATSIAEGYRDVAWVPPLVYGLAAATALSRMELDKHWASDVFVGAVIGYATAKGFSLLYRPDAAITAMPMISPGSAGLFVSADF